MSNKEGSIKLLMLGSVAIVGVGEGNVRPLKVSIRLHRLLWAYEPIDSNTRVELNLFNQPISLRFENGQLSCPREVVYQLSDNMQYQSFINHHVEVRLVSGDEVLGVSFFDPKVMEKKMVLPIFRPGSNKKVGDFDLSLKVTSAQTSYHTLQQIDRYLGCLEQKDPQELERLHSRMRDERIL